MIRIGIVGCGRILAAHLRGYRLLREAGVDDFQITALCARREVDALGYVKRGAGPDQRPAVSDIPGDPLAIGDEYLSDFQPGVPVAVYTDYNRMIAEGPIDAVNDFTIHSLHHQIAEVAFRHGKHLMSQKPLAVSMEAARRMCDLADAAGVTFGVFENMRFKPEVRRAAWALRSDGPAGAMQMAMMGYAAAWWAPDLIVAETPWRHVLADAGGITLDLGPHFFDLLRHIGGAEIKSISARTAVVEPVRYLIRDGKRVDPCACDADDTFYAHFVNEQGATGSLFGSWGGHGKSTIVGEGPTYYGSRGRISGDDLHLDGGSAPQSLAALYEAQAPEALKARHFPHGLSDDFAIAQYDWLDAIRRGAQPECSGREGLLDLACAFAVVESARAGREVSLAEVLSGELRDYQRVIDARHGLV
jgi:predicted dehydrogenase